VSKDHYVSQFHLREFCDPASLGTPDPWLWIGTLADSSIKRRSPKNVATATDLFAGSGGLADSNTTMETFLANEVESPAAFALRALRAAGLDGGHLPPALMRYLAWAASRSLPMQRLAVEWAERFGFAASEVVEPPPDGISNTAQRHRPVRLLHPEHGSRVVSEDKDAAPLLDAGWFPDPSESANFLEGAHIQAYYFQVRWFPRLRWFTLRPPAGSHFVIGDRPVGWGVPDCIDAPPSCLRDPAAFLIAPLSHGLALVGRNSPEPWSVTPAEINGLLAAWSHEWIAGPTADCVAEAMRNRGRLTNA
jgi:Protein of unknown function (DUF4238)